MLGVAIGALAGPAAAQHVSECDTPLASARNVDWSDPTRTFANDRVRLVALDSGAEEGPGRLLVTFPDPDGEREGCRLISAEDGIGYGGFSLRRAAARYGGQHALSIGVPATDAAGDPVLIEFVVDWAAGTVEIP
ncbi:hypothetical protein [Jannaschia seohaensis]|uniref:Uncharacterized protein n=1 Tax=Jannaschia seohaensis TaxID=475081 RepID=A0A2Y9ABS4_9RHOB|nr:hypothetical protein [Jannaschia seohaensis]PWJ20986.1 hypothetical protein BCF38_102233 [Jannaschia seohaensis]SSA41396.1 hypothetical protein SAMN05421539_102233 [Jannaschia seohaensis]